MNLVEAVKSCFTQYATFSGRASRYEFWNFILFLFLVSIILTIVNSLLFGPTITQEFVVTIDGNGEQTQGMKQEISYDGGLLSNVFGFLIILPWLAVTWRRLHDTGRPGWYGLLPFAVSAVVFALIYLTSVPVPIDTSQVPAGIEMPSTTRVPANGLLFFLFWLIAVGSFILVTIWLCRASEPSSNKYGPNPNESEVPS